MSRQEFTQVKSNYIQIQNNDWQEINRAFRYVWDQLDGLTGRRGSIPLGTDLDLNNHRAINAEDPEADTDLVTKKYADSRYLLQSTSLNPGVSNSPGGGAAGLPLTFLPSTKLQVARWDNGATLGSARIIDNDTYIIVGTGTTDASITANGLVVGSSDNPGDLLVVISGTSAEAIRLLPTTSGNKILSDRTGAGTYRDLLIYANNAEVVRFTTANNVVAAGNIGAGINPPTGRVHVEQGDTATPSFKGTLSTSADTNVLYIQQTNAGGTGTSAKALIYVDNRGSNPSLVLRNNATDKFVVKASGSVVASVGFEGLILNGDAFALTKTYAASSNAQSISLIQTNAGGDAASTSALILIDNRGSNPALTVRNNATDYFIVRASGSVYAVTGFEGLLLNGDAYALTKTYAAASNVQAISIIQTNAGGAGTGADSIIKVDNRGSNPSLYISNNTTVVFAVLAGGVQFGTRTAIGAETLTGYITITDAGGTSRKLGVVS